MAGQVQVGQVDHIVQVLKERLNQISQLDKNSCCRFIGLRIMLSIGQWDKIYPDWQVPNYSFIPNERSRSFAYLY